MTNLEEYGRENFGGITSSMLKVRWDNEAPHISIERLDEPAYCYEVDTEEVVDKP